MMAMDGNRSNATAYAWKGDAASFDLIYERYRPGLFAFLARMCGKRELAEDLLQETWLKFARQAFSLPANTDLGAWLFTVARNVLRSHRRWQVVDLERVRQLLFLPAQERTSPFEAVAATQGQAALERALAGLSSSDREVLLLVGVEGLSPAQAGVVLGLKPDVLRQRLSRARARLAAALGDEGGVSRAPGGSK
jgi:RNA polymerase sigma factor (sigma-70 family)